LNVKLPVAENWFTFGVPETVHVCPDGQFSVVEAVTMIELPLSELDPTASMVKDRLVELVAFIWSNLTYGEFGLLLPVMVPWRHPVPQEPPPLPPQLLVQLPPLLPPLLLLLPLLPVRWGKMI